MTGYQIYAQNSEEYVASYIEASTDDAALLRCLDEFPKSEGWSDHYVQNLETKVIVGCEIKSFNLDDPNPLLLED